MCRIRGWTIVHEYIDQGWSGAKVSRPALDEMMAAVAAIDPKKPATLKFEGIVVWKFDRLFRSLPHMLKAFETFQQKKLEFISLTEQIDTSTPAGRLLFGLLALIAEFERSLIAERIANGMKKAGAKKPGPKIGSKGPSRSTLWRRGRAG
jgi:site-specific DNA recombinase